MTRLLLWLFVINLGIAFGAGLYESRVVIPAWRTLPPAEWPNTGLMFWVYVTTVPLTLLTIANLIAAWTSRGPERPWHLTAAVLVALERVATFSYFIPTMVRLMGTEGPPHAGVAEVLSRWLLLNHARHALMLGGWLAALKALSFLSDTSASRHP